MASNVYDWMEKTRSLLMSGRQEERNRLAAPYTGGSGTLTFEFAVEGIVPGIRLSVGLNTFYVVSVSGSTAEVIGGQEGSSDTGLNSGELVRVAPRFTDYEIWTALVADLADLSSPDNGLFRMVTATLTYDPALVGYDLAGVTDLIDVYEVRTRNAGSGNAWGQLSRSGWRLDRLADPTVFASGFALQVTGVADRGPLQVLYRAPFTVPATTVDDQSVTGLPATAWDLPPMGAAMRLVVPAEIARNFTDVQTDTRRAAEVPAGAVANGMRNLAALRASRISAEAARLHARWPDRRF